MGYYREAHVQDVVTMGMAKPGSGNESSAKNMLAILRTKVVECTQTNPS